MKIPVSCNKDCGAGCPLCAVVEEGRVVKITDSAEKGEWMSGCGRGYRSHKVIYHQDRLRTPLIKNRETGEFREAGWEEAIEYTADNLQRIKKRHGAGSVLHSGGGGACRGALHNSHVLAVRFLSLFGGCTTASDTYSSAASTFTEPYIYGTGYHGIDAATLADSKFIFMPGANIADTRFGCELYNRLKALRKNGVRMVVLEPRKTSTITGLDAEWIKINPGTDTAFAAAVIHDLIANGGADHDFIEKYTHGFEPFRQWLINSPVKNADWAADICGCSADAVRLVADCYREYSPAALLPGLSLQRGLGGEDATRMMAVLQAVTGNIGRRGGSSGICTWSSLPRPRCGKLGMSPASAGAKMHYAPVSLWPDMILDSAHNPPLKAAYNCGGNYLVQGADSAKSVRAWAALDFSVTHELFLTPTAAASDVVFPVADYLERNDIVFAEGNFLLYSHKAVNPPPGVKSDYEIFCLLAERMSFGAEFSEGRSELEWLDYFLTSSDVTEPEEFKHRGIWFGADNERLAFTDFVADPETHPLKTPSGKIEISSEKFKAVGGNLFPIYTEHRPAGKFQLITPHAGSRINSQFINIEGTKNRNLQMNVADAAARGITDGSLVRISSNTGVVETIVELSEDIITGTACLSCSYSNLLTSTLPTLPSKGARTHSTFVDIEPA
ncbi:MAG TPA: molybdopterin oxidoreductase [Spirochaeta sp.]|nr:molybdopterin oxidoreductase [Spirochaeta sp.]